LTADEIHLFIISDFKGAWNSIAANKSKKIGRGNFMFGRQAMNLLEFVARYCAGDHTNQALSDYSRELKRIEPRYFTRLPSPCMSSSDFVLPNDDNTSGNLLLWALFDMMRHGLAHQYQQILVRLTDNKKFYIMLTGPNYGRRLEKVNRRRRPARHLAYSVDDDGDYELIVYPDIVYLDFERAVERSGILNRHIPFGHLTRPRARTARRSVPTGPYYSFDSAALEKALKSGHHPRV
jgi:hypothetical protein